MRIIYFKLLPLIQLAMISIDYTSYETKVSKDLRSQKCEKIRNLIHPSLEKSDILKYDTIFYPLDFLENSLNKFKNLSLHKQDEKDFLIEGLETKMSEFDINELFLRSVQDKSNYKNIQLSVRDYYQKEISNKIADSMSSSMYEKNILILPASLSLVAERASYESGEGIYFIVSMTGYKTVFNIYEVSKNENIDIKTLYTKSCDSVGDSILENIIDNYVRKVLDIKLKNEDFKVHLLPLISEVEYQENDFTLDIMDIIFEIKNKLGYNVDEYSIKDSYMYSIKGEKALLKETKFNLKEIKNEIERIAEKIKENISTIKNEIEELLSKYDTYNKFVISSFDVSVIDNILNIPDLINSQEKFIVDGAMKFVIKKMISDDLRILKKTTFIKKSQTDNLLEEIKIKQDFIKKIKEIKNKNGFSDHLPQISQEKIPDSSILDIDYKFENLKLQECTDFLMNMKKLEFENFKIEKSIKMRPIQIKKAEEILEKVLKIKDQNSEVWNMGLGNKYEEFKLFINTNRENMEILGQDIEFKADMLEGLMESYIRSFENKKKQEQEKIKEEEEEKKIKEEEKSQGEENKLNQEENKNQEEEINGNETEKIKGNEKEKINGNETFNGEFDKNKIAEMQEKFRKMLEDKKYDELLKDIKGEIKNEDRVNPDEDVKAEKDL